MTLNGFLILLLHAKTGHLNVQRAGGAAEEGALLNQPRERTCGEESLEQNLGD